MRSRVTTCAIVCLLVVFGAAVSPSDASITMIAPPPLSVAAEDKTSNDVIWLFLESRNNQNRQRVNIRATGTERTVNESSDFNTGDVSVPFDSWLFHFDPVGSSSTVQEVGGTWTFDTEILGVIVTSSLLNSSNGVLGATGTTYPTSNRGLELGLSNQYHDQITINPSGDKKTISFDFLYANSGIDQVRVLTVATPEPASVAVWSLLAIAGLCLGWLRKRRS